MKKNDFNLMGLIKRLALSMITIGLTNVLAPGMSNKGGLLNLAIIAIIVAVLQHLIVNGLGLSRGKKGISGFLVMGLIFFLAGKIVDSYRVTLLGAFIGALIYGFVDALIGGDKLYNREE